jgi:hypothetical protein
MNVTVKIDDQLGKDARHMAVDAGMSLSSWVSELIHKEVIRTRSSSKSKSLLQLLGDERTAFLDFDCPRDDSTIRHLDSF